MTDPVQQPAAAAVPKEALTWGMLCHLSALCLFIFPVFGNILGPLILWLLKKNDHPFIDEHGKESLNFQISMTVYRIAAAITVIGLIVTGVICIADPILTIIAAIKTSNGEDYRYPLTIRFIK